MGFMFWQDGKACWAKGTRILSLQLCGGNEFEMHYMYTVGAVRVYRLILYRHEDNRTYWCYAAEDNISVRLERMGLSNLLETVKMVIFMHKLKEV